MRKWKVFVHALLLATTPAFLAYPQEQMSHTAAQEEQAVHFEEKIRRGDWHDGTYDEFMTFFQELESGVLEERCTPEDLEMITQFIAWFASQGMLPGEDENNREIEKLLNGEDIDIVDEALSLTPGFALIPSISHEGVEVVPCRSFLKRAWEKTKKFFKKHKKAVIITTAAVVGAGAAVAIVGACSGGGDGDQPEATPAEANRSQNLPKQEIGPTQIVQNTSPTVSSYVQTTLTEEIAAMKENAAKQNVFVSPYSQFLAAETGRVMGSIFAHETSKNLETPLWQNEPSVDFSLITQQKIQEKFNIPEYLSANKYEDSNFLFYQIRGERALSSKNYGQAVTDFEKAIACNQSNALSYLNRGVAHFELGNYEQSIADYQTYTAQIPQIHDFSISEFSMGFARGLPNGMRGSGKGYLLFLSDVVFKPLETGRQIYQSLGTIAGLMGSGEWSTLSEALAPEVAQLVQEWETLPSETRGELAGYAFGKYGTDIILPGAIAKGVKSLKAGQELSVLGNRLKTAERTLLLESATAIGDSAQIRKFANARIVARAEELGFTELEIAQLEGIGTIGRETNSLISRSSHLHQEISFTQHALQRAIERNVSREAIYDAINSPLKVKEIRFDEFGRPSQRFIGKTAEVAMNPETRKVISVNPTSSKRLEKLAREFSDASNN